MKHLLEGRGRPGLPVITREPMPFLIAERAASSGCSRDGVETNDELSPESRFSEDAFCSRAREDRIAPLERRAVFTQIERATGLRRARASGFVGEEPSARDR